MSEVDRWAISHQQCTATRSQKPRNSRWKLFVLDTLRQVNSQTIESRLHVNRQAAAQFLVIELGMQIGQDRAPRLQPLDPGQRFRHAEMARMRLVTQCVNDPDVEPAECRHALRRQSAEVAGIGEAAEAKAKGRDVAMLLQNGLRGD